MSSPPLKSPRVVRWLSLLVVVVAIVVRFWPHAAATSAPGVPQAPVTTAGGSPEPTPPMPPLRVKAPGATSAPRFPASIGFRSREKLEQHFRKHGAEVHAASAADYLRMAQALRDAPAGGDVMELVRPDGVISRFDRISGGFVAFDASGVIRTYFRPNDGERYFQRQASRPHDEP
jgi:hypothetical protein